MAHNININKGKASFFSVKEKAWHGLGTVLKKCPTSAEAIEKAGLDFEVVKVPNIIEWPIGSGKFKPTPGSFSSVRVDNGAVLGDRLGKIYTIVQNKDAFTFFDSIVGKKAAIYETAGALGAGEIIFITAKLPSTIKIANKEDVEKYLLLTMAHDGSGAIQAMFTPIRVVCNNTLNAALRAKGHKVTIRHTKNAEEALKEAHKVLGITASLSDELAEKFNAMVKIKLDDKLVKGFIEQVFLPEEKFKAVIAARKAKNTGLIEELISTRMQDAIDSCYDYYYTGPGQQVATCKGTLWGAYNAITGYYQNVKEYSDATQKMKSNLLGGNYGNMQKAFDLAVEQLG